MDIKITLDSKQLYPAVINLKQFSSGTDVLTFLMEDYVYETTDLSKMDAYAVCDMVNQEVDEVKLEKQVVEGKLKLTWRVDGYTTQLDGHITYQIVFKDIANEKSVLWFSHQGIIFISESHDGDGHVAAKYPTILQQWEKRMDEVDTTASNAADIAKEQAKIATQKATESSQSALKAENEATEAQNNANKVEEMKDYIDKLINFEPTNIFEREVAEARGDFPLLGNRLDKFDEDLSKKAPSAHTHTKSQITDMPTKVSQFTNDSKYQTEAQVKALVSALVDSAPETMDTLKELADALGNDPNFATTVANQIGTKASTEYVNAELAKKAPVSHSHSVASKTASGFMPQLPNETATTKYLRQDGTWQVPPDTKYILPKATTSALGGIVLGYAQNAKNYPVLLDASGKAYVAVPWTDTNTTYGNMVGASASAAGKAGLVPAPAANNQSKYLRGDGTWQTPPNTTYSNFKGASASAAGGSGLVPAPAAGGQENVLHGDGTWKDKSDFYVDTTLQKKVTAKTSRNASASKVKVQLQDVSGRALYVETSADNIYITSGRFSGQLLSSVLEKVVVADSYVDGVLTVDVPDNIVKYTQGSNPSKIANFGVEDDVDPGFIYDILKGESK